MEKRTPENTIRVFPRRTTTTPTDPNVFVDEPPNLEHIDIVHISVTFTYDKPRAEKLARICELLGYTVELGGPAYGKPSGDFQLGLYLKDGYVITSRGCNRHCKHCLVPIREGGLRELPITYGHNVLDDNLLACSPEHITGVFEMLKREHSRTGKRPLFTGGLEAALLQPWHIDLLREAKTERMYFAYDTPDDWEPLLFAGKLLRDGGISKHKARCYVLTGYGSDTFDDADKRIRDTWKAGFIPFVMQYRDAGGKVSSEWRKFLCDWERPQSRAKKLEETR